MKELTLFIIYNTDKTAEQTYGWQLDDTELLTERDILYMYRIVYCGILIFSWDDSVA